MTQATPLSLHGRDVTSVFDLLGRNENDLTAALGFTLSRSPILLKRLTRLLLGHEPSAVSLRLETADTHGRTDLEIQADEELIVVEAKQGWLLPTAAQLALYAPRVRGAGGGCLATLSQASPEWAAYGLPEEVDGVPVRHVPWSALQAELRASRTSARGEQRTWLDQLHEYLRRAVAVREPQDSWVYCVVISDARPGDGGSRTFRQFVDDGIYFHPFGTAGWPKEAPNFLALRWQNSVQRVHRVMSSEVVPTLQARWPDIPVTPETAVPHAIYRLGPALPCPVIPSGINYRANRVWVLLDQLLLGPTLKAALEGTDRLTQSS